MKSEALGDLHPYCRKNDSQPRAESLYRFHRRHLRIAPKSYRRPNPQRVWWRLRRRVYDTPTVSLGRQEGTMRTTKRTFINWALTGAIAGGALLMTNLTGRAAPITEEAAHAIAIDAYIYFYPLVTMDLTRKQSTN